MAVPDRLHHWLSEGDSAHGPFHLTGGRGRPRDCADRAAPTAVEPRPRIDILFAVAIDADSDTTADAGDATIGSSIVAVDTENGSPNVVLTYDDGPQPGGTDAVLSALAD